MIDTTIDMKKLLEKNRKDEIEILKEVFGIETEQAEQLLEECERAEEEYKAKQREKIQVITEDAMKLYDSEKEELEQLYEEYKESNCKIEHIATIKFKRGDYKWQLRKPK